MLAKIHIRNDNIYEIYEIKYNVNARHVIWGTELAKAARVCHIDKITQMLNAEATAAAREGQLYELDDRNAALRWAATRGYVEAVKLLIKRTKVNEKDRNGYTALHWAAREGHTDVAKLLIDAGADVDATNGREETPMYWARLGGHTEVVQLLVEAGADANSSLLYLH